MNHDHNKPVVPYFTLVRESLAIGIPVIIAVAAAFVGAWDAQSGGFVLIAAGVAGVVSAVFFHLFQAANKEIRGWERVAFLVVGLLLLAGSVIVGLGGLAAF